MPEDRRHPGSSEYSSSYLLGSVGVEGAVATEVLDVAGADGCLHIGEVEEAEGQLDVESQTATPEGRSHGLAQDGGLESPQPSHEGRLWKPIKRCVMPRKASAESGDTHRS